MVSLMKEHWFKIALLIVLITGLVVGLYSWWHYLDRKSDLAEKTHLESKEQEKKAYIAKRRIECYEIYEKERKKWSNVEGMRYDVEKDVCIVTYKAIHGEWQGIECDDLRSKDETNPFSELNERYYNCIAKTFTKKF